MKKTTLTEKKAEQAPNGGVLVGKRKGQTIIHDKGTMSGYLVGKTHAEGGIKAVNKSTGQPLEMQGGEVVITAPAVADQTKNEFNGKMMTNREILSQINVNGGGVAFANGGDISKVKHTGASYNYGGRTMTDYEIIQEINSCVCEHSEFDKGGDVDYVTYKEKYNKKYNYRKNKSHSLKEISKDTGVSMKGLRQIYNKGIGAYKTNPSSVRPNVKSKEQWAMARVYSAVMGGKASKVDSNELKMNKGGGVDKWKKITEENLVPNLGTFEYKSYVYKNAKIYYSKEDKKWLLEINDKMINGYPTLAVAKKRAEMMLVDDFKKGGDLVEDSKKGDHPSRDLNNYNDVLDVDADGVVGAETGLYSDGGDIDTDGTGGADASSGVGAFENGGDLDFLNDVDRVFDEGGSVDVEIDSISIAEGSRTYNGTMPKSQYYSFSEFASDLKNAFLEQNKVLGYFYFYPIKDGVKVGERRLAIQFKDSKNTVLNFNPLTGKSSDFYKQIERRYGSSIRRNNMNFSKWLDGKSSTKSEPKSESSSKGSESKGKTIDLSQTKIWVGDDLKLSEAVQNKAFELGWYWESNPKKEVHKDGQKALFFFNDKSILSGDEDTFKSVTLKEIFASDLLGSAPSSTSGNQSGKFSSGEIDAFNQIDKIVKDFEIEFVDGMSWGKDSSTKDFDIVNTLTGEVYKLRKFNKSLGVFSFTEDANIDKSRKLITDFNKWKKSNPTSASESKEESKQEEQSIRNFELEKKYLTQRINALSSELDLKRPILSNEEIAFYQREINKFVSKLRVVSNDEMELKPIQARVNGVYKVKWGDYTKQYPETDTLSINGVKSELTFEEFLTVRTPEFKSFFGNWEQAYFDNTYSGVSKIINPKTKEPMPVFHGTNVLFTEWKTYETNNAHYFAVKREMSDFFATSWETRSDKAGVDSKAIKALNPNTGTFLYRCFLDIRNPIDFSKFGVEKRPIKEFLLFLKINYNIGDYDFWTNLGNARGFTSETRVYAWQIIRLWQNFTKYVKNFTTYDGYIFYEYIPDTPFGGLENASLSFCAFESNQIKFADAYEFNALSNDSRFDFGGTL